MNETSGYNLWPLVIVNSAIFIVFAFSFTKPKTFRDWRSLGAFSAFLVALFTEMYGFPLTIYLLSGWLGSRYPSLDLYAHNNGHLWETLLGWKGDPHLNPLHFLSDGFVVVGFIIVASAWKILHEAQKSEKLATSGIYALLRHPQYDGFILVMTGFLLQWPTILTLVMFPILVFMYARLALYEEKEMERRFGQEYLEYAKRTPRFFLKISVGEVK